VRAGGLLEKRDAGLSFPKSLFTQSLLPLQIDRRGAIADRIGNVKIHAAITADRREKLAPSGQ